MILPPPPGADTYGCITRLDKQKLASVAYVSFGSVTAPPPHELVALAEVLETSEAPFVCSLRDNSKLESGVFTKHGVLNSLDKVLSQDVGENEGEHKGTSTTRKERHWTKRDLWIILLLCQMETQKLEKSNKSLKDEYVMHSSWRCEERGGWLKRKEDSWRRLDDHETGFK
ncbi:hypothetical protein H0E87_030461 [Populus deltoides]|uniref:Uncharacterized protein n=1 Tax=Populus deltoides TaxID=3696 RepID=A0A8T2WGR9_POPDE|nr:hypothetical protein H0E87_030461 [Populus deltoides]